MDLDDNSSENIDYSSKTKKNKTISEILLILRDRWLLAITLALPFSLSYVYKELQVPELFLEHFILCVNTSSSNFKLTEGRS